jgi:hypothetical protein
MVPLLLPDSDSRPDSRLIVEGFAACLVLGTSFVPESVLVYAVVVAAAVHVRHCAFVHVRSSVRHRISGIRQADVASHPIGACMWPWKSKLNSKEASGTRCAGCAGKCAARADGDENGTLNVSQRLGVGKCRRFRVCGFTKKETSKESTKNLIEDKGEEERSRTLCARGPRRPLQRQAS